MHQLQLCAHRRELFVQLLRTLLPDHGASVGDSDNDDIKEVLAAADEGQFKAAIKSLTKIIKQRSRTRTRMRYTHGSVEAFDPEEMPISDYLVQLKTRLRLLQVKNPKDKLDILTDVHGNTAPSI